MQVGILHQVVGVGPIPGEPEGKRPQGAEVIERLVIERRRPVLRSRFHVICSKHSAAPDYSTNRRDALVLNKQGPSGF
jgi:hypothetical protein